MPKHKELVCVEVNDGAARLCLDEVVRDDEDNRIEYALVWRGNKLGPDGFNHRPAYFNWAWVGELLGKAVTQDVLQPGAWRDFLRGLGASERE